MKRLLVILILACFSCAFVQSPVTVKQVTSDHQIEIRKFIDRDDAFGMYLWFEFEVSNNSKESTWIQDADFLISKEFGPLGKFRSFGNPLLELMVDRSYYFNPFPDEIDYREFPYPRRYRVRSYYQIFSTSDIFDSLTPYIKKMRARGGDSLLFGTLQEFKARHPYVVDRLLRGDSVEFTVRNIQTKKNTYIAFPIEY